MTTVIEAPAKRYFLKPARIERSEFNNTRWSVSPEHGTPYEEILKPGYWAHVCGHRNMKMNDRIDVFPDDGSYFAELIVRDVGANWAKVAEFRRAVWEPDEAPSEEVAGYHAVWQGIANKHVVIRESDNEVVLKGFKLKSEAQAALLDYVKTLAR